MDGNQPTTAREWLNIKRREEYELHTQDPTNGADFDTLVNSVRNSVGSRKLTGVGTALGTDQWFNESVRFEDHITK